MKKYSLLSLLFLMATVPMLAMTNQNAPADCISGTSTLACYRGVEVAPHWVYSGNPAAHVPLVSDYDFEVAPYWVYGANHRDYLTFETAGQSVEVAPYWVYSGSKP